MDKELKEFLESLAAGQKTLTDTVAGIVTDVTEMKTKGPAALAAANLLPRVEKHATALETLAASMEGDGIGADVERGHATILRKMAGDVRAKAALGQLPAIFYLYGAAQPDLTAAAATANAEAIKKAVEDAVKPLKDANAGLETKVADLTAAAAKGTTAPERKTLSPAITTLLAKGGIELPKAEGEKIPVSKLDAAMKDMPIGQRLQMKTGLRQAGLID